MNLQTSYYTDSLRNKLLDIYMNIYIYIFRRSKPTYAKNDTEIHKENDFDNKFKQKTNLDNESEGN